MLVCRHCGWENPDEAAFCTNCGRPLARQRTLDQRPTIDQAPPGGPAELPKLPKLSPPPDPGRMAPTLLDFRMPSEMLAELSKARRAAPQQVVLPDAAEDERSGDALGPSDPPPLPIPTVLARAGARIAGGAAADAGRPGPGSDPPATAPSGPPLASTPAASAPLARVAPADLATGAPSLPVETSAPPASQPPASQPPASAPPASAPAASEPPASQPPASEPLPPAAMASGFSDVAPLEDKGPSTIVELPPVLLITEPPVALPSDLPAPPGLEVAARAGGGPDDLEPLPPPADDERPDDADLDPGQIVLLGAPIIEPPRALGEGHSAAERAPALAGEEASPPAAPRVLPAAAADAPLPGTDRVIPAAEIAIRSRPPQPLSAEDEPDDFDLGRTVRAIALSDIAKALRAQAAADDKRGAPHVAIEQGPVGSTRDQPTTADPAAADPAAADPGAADPGAADPGAAEPPPVVDESLDGFESFDGPLEALAPEPAEGEEDGFQDIIEPSELDESDEFELPPPSSPPEVAELIEEASMPPPAAAAVDEVAEALAAEGRAELLSTDELERLRTGQPRPPPVPPPVGALVLRVMNREVGDDVVVEVGRQPVTIGSGAVDLSVEDPWLSPRHARVTSRDGRLTVEDLESLNGLWIRVRGATHLEPGDAFAVGRQVCAIALEDGAAGLQVTAGVRRIGAPPTDSRFLLNFLGSDGLVQRTHRLSSRGMRLGRHIGEILIPDDGQLSAAHLVLRVEGGRIRLDDLSSRNGTWVRARGPCVLDPGDSFMTGRTIWRVGTGLRQASP